MDGPKELPFNFQQFMFDNGIAGVTLGTLLGFSSQKVFDVFREIYLEPGLQFIYKYIFETMETPNTKMLAVIIEYSVIILLIYLVSRFLLYPALYAEILDEEQRVEGGRAKMKHIVQSLDEIKRIL